MNDKLSEWGSFFPNIKNNYVDRFIWHECYNEQIIDIFTIIKNIIRERYKIKINWESNKLFNDVSILLFNCSSKYISYDDLNI